MIINEITNIANWYKDFLDEHFFIGVLLITITIVILYDLILIPHRIHQITKAKEKEVEVLCRLNNNLVRSNLINFTFYSLINQKFEDECNGVMKIFNEDVKDQD